MRYERATTCSTTTHSNTVVLLGMCMVGWGIKLCAFSIPVTGIQTSSACRASKACCTGCSCSCQPDLCALSRSNVQEGNMSGRQRNAGQSQSTCQSVCSPEDCGVMHVLHGHHLDLAHPACVPNTAHQESSITLIASARRPQSLIKVGSRSPALSSLTLKVVSGGEQQFRKDLV